MKYNTKISILPGLQDTFGVFNLDADFAFSNIKVDIIIDGDQYVESDASLIAHAGSSNFKEFEGINSEDSNTWDLSNFGEKFREKLLRYFANYSTDINNSRGFDIYEDSLAYKNYKNLFTVVFLDAADPNIELTGLYINYKSEPTLADGKACISRTLNEVNGTDPTRYIFLGASVIYHSKYYNIYKSSDISVPVLLPILYTQEDLAKLNLSIANNNAWINSLTMFTAWNDYNGSDRDYRREYRYECDPTTGNFKLTRGGNISDFNHNADVDWAYSLFKLHSSGKHFITDLEEVSEEKYNDYYPKGFMIFTLKDESLSLGINYNNARSDEHFHKPIYSSWRSWFNSKDDTYWISSHGRADKGGDETVLGALQYRGDKEDNVHLLNCWFSLKASGSGDNRVVTQELSYKLAGKRPAYIGTCIASIFTNIYHYVSDSLEPITLITDTVYLNRHYTTFTKDIIYRASVRNMDNPSRLLVFKGLMKYGGNDGYVELVKRVAGATNDPVYNGEKNVKAVIQSCLKNVPLQYRLAYKEPNTDLVNANSDFYILKTIDSDKGTRIYGKLNPDRLYQLTYDTSGKPVITFLNNSFKIKYLSTIKLNEDNTISGTYSKTFLEENNPYIYNTWDINTDLTLSNYKYQSIASRYYSIVTIYSDFNILFADYDKNEVLLPFAKFVS